MLYYPEGKCDLSYKINNNVTRIHSYAFYNNSSIKEIELSSSITTIDYCAFVNCTSLTNINISDNVELIGDSAFSPCTSLTEINVNKDNQYYLSVDGILFNKDMTTIIKYPEGKAGNYKIPDSVTTVGNDAFMNCKFLKSVEVPYSIHKIGNITFGYYDSYNGNGGVKFNKVENFELIGKKVQLQKNMLIKIDLTLF